MTQKKILLTGGRLWLTLDLARQLHAAGHEVMVADTSKWVIARFSNAVSKTFVVPSPRYDEAGFVEKLRTIVEDEKIEYLVPTWEDVLFVSQATDKLPSSCQVLAPPFAQLIQLHNKWLFYKKLESHGIPSPKTMLVNSAKDLEDLDFETAYALKASFSRASQDVRKIEPGEKPPDVPIEPYNPWIAQEWIEGKPYCTYSVAHQGKLKALSVYGVDFAIEGKSCLTFEAIDHPDIRAWIEHFVEVENYTGQIAFDFIQRPNGELFAIECNPRSTSGLLLFNPEDRLDQALLNSSEDAVHAKIGTSKQIAMGMLIYGWRTGATGKTLRSFFKKLFSIKDVIINLKDLKPVLAMPFVLTNILWKSIKSGVGFPDVYTHDLEWNGQAGASCEVQPAPVEEDDDPFVEGA